MKVWEFLKRRWSDALTVALLAWVVWLWFRPPATVTRDERPAPDLRYTTLDGTQGRLADLKGKVVLVNFWATWCPFCRKEMPDMERFYQDYRQKGFEVIAFSTDDDRRTVEAFLAEHDYHFPVAMASAQHTAAFGGISTLPTSFIIDPEGRIRTTIVGQVYYGRLEELVTPLLPRKE